MTVFLSFSFYSRVVGFSFKRRFLRMVRRWDNNKSEKGAGQARFVGEQAR